MRINHWLAGIVLAVPVLRPRVDHRLAVVDPVSAVPVFGRRVDYRLAGPVATMPGIRPRVDNQHASYVYAVPMHRSKVGHWHCWLT